MKKSVKEQMREAGVSMLMGDFEDDLIKELDRGGKDKDIEIMLTNKVLRKMEVEAIRIIRTRTFAVDEYLFVEWLRFLSSIYNVPMHFNNGHSMYFHLFGGWWTSIVEHEKYIESKCKERNIDYSTYPILSMKEKSEL